MNKYKVVIIGGGPSGLSAGLYTSRGELSPLILAGSPPGGQLMLTTEVENFPGHDSILGSDLIDNFRKQAEKFGSKIIDDNVTRVDLSTHPFKVYVGDVEYVAESLIIATGAKARWLGLESEQRLRGKGVSACATCDGFFFRDKIVGVVGGGDSACEEALVLTKFAKKVYILYRRDKLRASRIMQNRVLNHPKIEVVWNSVVDEVLGENRVEGVKLTRKPDSQKADGSGLPRTAPTNVGTGTGVKVKNSKQEILKLDGLFIAIGHKPDTDLFKDQILLDKKGYIVTTSRIAMENLRFSILKLKNKKEEEIENELKIKNLKLEIPKFDYRYPQQTSVSGVFAAGDCVDYAYQQASTAAGMGVQAALDVEKWRNDSNY